jgi:alkanesulfonate monooxygenase SsuD/methylene tetrahydromethanopterin reductase-like flavin-dependent oxidoreductase (luciferase family)
MQIGLGIDSRFALSDDNERALAGDAASLGYTSLWTPIGNTREPFDICAQWHEASGLDTGIAVAPLSAWSIDDLVSVAKATHRRCGGRFTLGVGAGRLDAAPIRAMREAIDTLRERLAGVPIYLGALGPQMLALAGARYDGAALNWCTADHVLWSRMRVAASARAAGRNPSEVHIHEYVRVCVDEDVSAARLAFAKMVMSYAMARPGADRSKGYRAHFARMGFDRTLTVLESERASGATEDELAERFPDELLRRVGYWGPPENARAAFTRLAEGLDIAIVRLVPARSNDAAAVRMGMVACAPRR